jgi:protein-S-isoprenylcysteine O-methyltransferase Ste14
VLLLKNLVFTLLVPGTVAVWLPWTILDATGAGAAPAPARAAAFVAFALGASVYAWCVFDFASFGRGTPAPIDAPRRLVARGLYRFVRNPMYVGVLLVIAGWVLRSGSAALLLYGAGVALAFHLFVVLYEEPVLRRSFGGEYEAYCSRVGRWLPRLGRREP